MEVKVEATNFVGYLTLSWPVQVRKVDPVNVSGSCVTREAEGDVQGGSREAGTSGKVLCVHVNQVRKVALCLVLTCAFLSLREPGQESCLLPCLQVNQVRKVVLCLLVLKWTSQ